MKKRMALLLTLALLATTSLSFAGQGTSNVTQTNPAKDRPDANNTLVVSMGEVTGNLLPLFYETTYDMQAINLIFDSLYTNDEKGSFNVPKLAESYTLSKDKLTYTFKLRKNVKWSDGKPFTAKDVENTFLWLADATYEGRFSGVASKIDGYQSFKDGKSKTFKGVKVIDNYTIAFKCAYANVSNFSDIAITPIMPAHLYKYESGKINKMKALQDKGIIVGSGRYIFKQLEPGAFIALKANPNWYGGKVNVINLMLTCIQPKDQFEAFRAGDIDIQIKLAATQKNKGEIIEQTYLTINNYPINSYGYMGFNLRDERLKDVKVRQALTYGFNRQAFIDLYYNGFGTVCNAPVTKASWAYTDDLNAYEFDPDKAIQLLESAGWKKGTDGIRAKNGKKLSFTWDSYTDSKYVETMIPMLKADWLKIGVQVEENLLEFNALVEKVYTYRDFDMYNMAWSFLPDPSTRDIFHSAYDLPDGNNAVGLKDSQIDKLADLADSEFDQSKRAALMHQYAKRINEILPYMFICQSEQWDVSNSRVKNFTVSTFCDWTYHIEKVTLEK